MIPWVAGVLMAIAGVTYALWQRMKDRRLLIAVDDLLDSAINGTMSESYQDTLPSAIENKLLKYIAITEAEKQKLSKEREHVRRLVSDISHQTKASISTLKVYGQLFGEANHNTDSVPGAEAVHEIVAHTQRLEFLIESLVKMSRLETGILQMKLDTIPAAELIGMALSPFFMKAEKKGVAVTVEACDDALLYCDKKWTAEALGNILDNAIKYAKPEGGTVSIVLIKMEMYTQIQVRDNGIGLDGAEINDIFKRFYRGGNAGGYDGVGIGLYIAREIMRAQGGYITASSGEEVTTFSLFIYNPPMHL